MRVATLSLDFGLLLLVLVALLHTQGASAHPKDNCPSNNCLPSNQCELVATEGSCRSGNTCCSLVKQEFRTLCRQHGGECMNACPARLTARATDCAANKVCCVLV